MGVSRKIPHVTQPKHNGNSISNFAAYGLQLMFFEPCDKPVREHALIR